MLGKTSHLQEGAITALEGPCIVLKEIAILIFNFKGNY